MALKFDCRDCGKTIVIKYLKVGEVAKCRNCGAEIVVPGAASEVDEEPQYHKPVAAEPAEHEAATVIIPCELGPRNLGSILAETFKIYQNNFFRLFIIVAIPEVFLVVLVYFWTPELSPSGEIEYTANSIIAFVIIVVVYFVAYALWEGALIHAISEQYLRRPVSIVRAYRFAWGRLGAMIFAEILAGLAVGVMFITVIGIPFAIYFAVRWIFIWQAALLEGCGPKAALSRSSDLVKGNWWRVLGVILVLSIVIMIISFVLERIPTVGSTIETIISTLVFITGVTLLYFDLRVRKEGYSLETLGEELHIA